MMRVITSKLQAVWCKTLSMMLMGPQAALDLTARQRQSIVREVGAMRGELAAMTERQQSVISQLRRISPQTSVSGRSNTSKVRTMTPCSSFYPIAKLTR